MTPHIHPVQIYYEDTDLTGSVYHANYLAYFERAREHALGVDKLVGLYREQGLGFVVYRAELTYKSRCVHGETIEVVSTASLSSAYRVAFDQRVRGQGESKWRVLGTVELVCVDANHKLVTIPQSVQDTVNAGQ